MGAVAGKAIYRQYAILMTNTQSRILTGIPAFVITWIYAAQRYHGSAPEDVATLATTGYIIKPYIFRALMPWVARQLMALFDLHADTVVVLLIALCGLGFALALRGLLLSLYAVPRIEIAVLVALGGLLILIDPFLIYDIANVTLWTLAIMCLWHKKIALYFLVFILASINRETSIFMILLFITLLYRHLPRREFFILSLFQAEVYALIQLAIRNNFHTAAGKPFWFTLWDNLQTYLDRPFVTGLHILILAGLFYLVAHNWEAKPKYIRLSFVVLMPLFAGMYFLFGQTFEYRVFAELYPLFVTLVVPTLVKT